MKLFDELLAEYREILWKSDRGFDQRTGLDTVDIDITADDAPEDTRTLQTVVVYENERALYYLLHGYRDQIVESMSYSDFVDSCAFHKSFRSGYVVESKDSGVDIDSMIHACLSCAPIFWYLFDKYFQIDKEKYTYKEWNMSVREPEFKRRW